MIIRKAALTDAKGIAKVHVESWKTTYSKILPADYLNELSYEQREEVWKKNITVNEVFVAENDCGEIVGFSTGGLERSGNFPSYIGELYAIYILKNYQGFGLGKALVKPVINFLLEQNISSMLVLVLKDNQARYFYEALGAKEIDVLQLKIAGIEAAELVYGWKDIRIV